MSISAQKVVLVDITLPFCDRVHSTSPCTAARADGSECYNTFPTCQDRANYSTTTGRTYRFTMADGPLLRGVSALRMLMSHSAVAGKIDPRRGLGGRDSVVYKFHDEPHDDAGVDPYAANRNEVRGFFWLKFLARNRNYQGSTLIHREGYLEDDGTLDVDSMVSRRYIVEEITAGSRGSVSLRASDVLKALDTALIPEPSNARLAAALSAGASSATLQDGHSLSDGAVTIRIDDEIMTATLSGNSLSSMTRGVAGTSDENHSEDDRVQRVEVFSTGSIDDVWARILTLGGVEAGLHDTVGAAAEIDLWQSSFTWASGRAVYISKPTKATRLLADLMEQTACMTWWDPVAQRVRLRSSHPRSPGTLAATLTDDANVVARSVQVSYLEAQRITRLAIYYGIQDWSRPFDKQDEDTPAYTRIQEHIDADAESVSDYGDVRPREIYAYWLASDMVTEVQAMAFRVVSRARNAPRSVRLKITDRDAVGIDLGANVDVQVDELVDVTGASDMTQCIVLGIRPPASGGIEWEYTVEATELDDKWSFYAENSAPVYSAATDAQRQYAHYADNTTKRMPNGDAPYLYV